MRIKLYDVAQRAGVSESSVSRVINGKPGVSAQRRSKILAVLAELGYEPPTLRSSSRPRPVGLVLPELDNPIFPAYAQAFETLLAGSNCLPVLGCGGRNGASEGAYLQTLAAENVAGIIVVAGRHAIVGSDHSHYRELLRRSMPMVFVNGSTDELDVPTVSTDVAVAMTMAVRHVTNLGHRRIGLLAGPSDHISVGRLRRGFERAVAASELGADAGIVEASMFSVEGGSAGAHRLLDAEVTAIVTGSDVMALGAARAARDRDLRVPEDVSVVGFDDSDLMGFTNPPLTTIRQPVEAIAAHAVELLLAQISGKPYTTSEYFVRPDLIVRSSTARHRGTPTVGLPT